MQDSYKDRLRAIFKRSIDSKLQEDEFFSKVAETKSTSNVSYALFIDTYNLFCAARDGLIPIFQKANETLRLRNVEHPDLDKPRRPSAREYVTFADSFLQEVSKRYEKDLLSRIPNSISEDELRRIIRELLSGKRTVNDIPDVNVIVCFNRVTYLFGAEFDKDEHLQAISATEKKRGTLRIKEKSINLRNLNER